MKSTQEENTILTSSNMELQKIPSTVFNASVSYVTYKQTVFNDAEQNISDKGGFQLLDLIITELKSHMTN